ncbi:MAG: sigma-70 family RNA polymerase sigma factor [Planctomycetota bacterium]
MSLSDVDRNLLDRCLRGDGVAWSSFVDRFVGLMVHVVKHTVESRGLNLREGAREELVADIFTTIIKDDCRVLRRFQRNSSLATYLTVVARRVVVRRLTGSYGREVLLNGRSPAPSTNSQKTPAGGEELPDEPSVDDDIINRLANREHAEYLLGRLEQSESQAIRMRHLDGKSYAEIATAIGISENSVGPLLTRAREKMRSIG